MPGQCVSTAVASGWPSPHSRGVIVVEEKLATTATAERIWDVLTTHEQMPAWFPAVRSVVLDPPGEPDRDGLGAVRHIQAIGPTVVEEIIEWDPPHRYVYTLLRGGPIRNHRGEVTVETSARGAVATWRIQFEPVIPLSGIVLQPFMRRLARSLLSKAVAHAEA